MEPILSNSNPQSQKRRIVFQIYKVLYVIPIIGAAYFGLIHRVEIWEYVNNTFYSYEEIGNIDCVTFMFKKNQMYTELFQKIEMATQRLLDRLGPPLVCGKLKVNFNAMIGDFGGQMNPGNIWSNARTISFLDQNISKQLIYHELIHAMYQKNEFINNCPRLATEGLTEALADDISNEGIPLLDPDYYDYYLNGISGFVQPDKPLPENLALKNLYYSISALFFKALIQTDANLVQSLFYDPPSKKIGWNDFLQSMIDHSESSRQIMLFINHTAVFNPVSQHFFAVPIRRDKGSIRSILLYIERLASIKQKIISIKTVYLDSPNNYQKTMLLTCKGGVAEVYIEPIVSGSVSFKCDLDGTHLETVLKIL